MKTLTISIEGRNNFHNARPINIRYRDEQIATDPWGEHGGGEVIILTDSQARRLGKHFCGMRDCTCGSGVVWMWDTDSRTGKTIWAIAGPKAEA